MSSSVLQPGFRFPFALEGLHPNAQNGHIWAFNAILDLQKANSALKTQINAVQPTTTLAGTSTEILNTVTNTVVDALAGLGTVNDQTGNTAYTTQSGDAGTLLILNDASPVAVSLNSAASAPFALFITNFGAGVATLTPTSGTINGGASLTLLQNQSIWVVFNGTNWLTDAFTAPPLNSPAAATKFLTAYASATGVFSNAQPAFTDISGTIAILQLPASVPVVSFGVGAPAGSSTEGYLYFDTTLAVYVGYVYHSGAWNQY